MLKSSLCDYSDAYVLVKGTITIQNTAATEATPNNKNKQVKFENCVPFINCINQISNTNVGGAKDIDVLILMYSLIEYSDLYAKAS